MKRMMMTAALAGLGLIWFGYTGVQSASPADDPAFQQLMRQHIADVKISNPGKYKEMVDAAGGVITDCRSCHKEIKEKE